MLCVSVCVCVCVCVSHVCVAISLRPVSHLLLELISPFCPLSLLCPFFHLSVTFYKVKPIHFDEYYIDRSNLDLKKYIKDYTNSAIAIYLVC
jgi:hypothetical protein